MVLPQTNLATLTKIAEKMQFQGNPRLGDVLERIKIILTEPSPENKKLIIQMCEVHAFHSNFQVVQQFLADGFNPKFLSDMTCLIIHTEHYYEAELLRINSLQYQSEIDKKNLTNKIEIMKDLQEKIEDNDIDWQKMLDLCLKIQDMRAFYAIKRIMWRGAILTQEYCDKVVEEKNIWIANLLNKYEFAQVEGNPDKTLKNIKLIQDRVLPIS